MLIFSPIYFLLPHKQAWFVPRFWSNSLIYLLKYVVGQDIKVSGIEHIEALRRRGNNYIIAIKHQSAWETFALLRYFDDPSYILKRELLWIPFFGWFLAKMGMIAIDRGSPVKALKQIIKQASNKLRQGRQIIIFPEGTRTKPGSKVSYKVGIATLYKELNIAVLPIAHNAGLYWPGDDFRRYSGTIEVRILPPIEPGLEKQVFMERLSDMIEDNCEEILLSLSHEAAPPKLLPYALSRLQRN